MALPPKIVSVAATSTISQVGIRIMTYPSNRKAA
jgi:hypothetical protein